MTNLTTYKELKEKYQSLFFEINKKYNIISGLRFLAISFIFIFFYLFLKTDELYYIWFSVAMLLIFFVLVKWHDKISFKRNYYKTIVKINEDEINFVEKRELPFENGIEFLPKKHDYAYDLDFFGNNSIFQNINRTATFIGKITLANTLLTKKNNEEILETQEAIKELSTKVNFRQDVYALALINKDSEQIFQKLIKWAGAKENVSPVLKVVSFVFPALFLVFFVLSFINDSKIFSQAALIFFLINLSIIGKYFKKIKNEIQGLSKINKIIKNYSLIIKKIEEETFKSKKLINLQKTLEYNSIKASKQIDNLSEIIRKIESILNPIGAMLTNGFFLYHIHAYRSLVNWKNDFANQINICLDVIGEFENFNSFANFSFNNPEYCFPKINNNYELSFNELSHPLINKKVRVNNNISFSEHNFIILTGSNMSGKSTFLRSLGINMILAGIGSPICAKSANIHPLKVLVSMRLSDSLEDNESYFFAEVKRLKEIMDKLENEPSFILLDEILRGTNSDDKRLGTIEVIKKMISKKAIGAIATHDLEVCNTTKQFPDILTNKNFEVEIVNNELYFDYKLKNGVCKNKSASFLMKKMNVI